ncbi:MAG: formate dehydrogenase accessory protein FdhE [Acidobacteria bacterium]|nr:MAG: formate dehydrogenase accessory protein FdhE [Acidobacteriota bacterium]
MTNINIPFLGGRESLHRRVNILKSKYPEASELLDFYWDIYRLQEEQKEHIRKKGKDWKDSKDWFIELLDFCIQRGSPVIKERAEELRHEDWSELVHRMERFLIEKEENLLDRFFFLSFLAPFYELKREILDIDPYNWLRNHCPVCGFRPSLSYLADTEDVEGGRFLVCPLCDSHWLYNRAMCVSCGNVEDESIDYYYDQSNSAVQLQVCKRCGYYIKLVDLRIDGLAIPRMDDVATLTLDLWAEERGFKRFEKNLFGL